MCARAFPAASACLRWRRRRGERRRMPIGGVSRGRGRRPLGWATAPASRMPRQQRSGEHAAGGGLQKCGSSSLLSAAARGARWVKRAGAVRRGRDYRKGHAARGCGHALVDGVASRRSDRRLRAAAAGTGGLVPSPRRAPARLPRHAARPGADPLRPPRPRAPRAGARRESRRRPRGAGDRPAAGGGRRLRAARRLPRLPGTTGWMVDLRARRDLERELLVLVAERQAHAVGLDILDRPCR